MNAALSWQLERIKSMTAEEKLRVSHALWIDAWNACEAGVRAANPAWANDAVLTRVRELMGRASA